jgi:adenylate cyclase
MKDRKIIWFITVTILPFLLYIVLYRLGTISRIENTLIDFRQIYFNPNRSFSDKVILLDFDENTFETYGKVKGYGRWPWNRDKYREIIEFVSQGAPASFLFDILFTEESNGIDGEEYDRSLAEITQNIPFVSHALQFRKEILTEDEIEKERVENQKFLASYFSKSNNLIEVDSPEKLNFKAYNLIDHPIRIISESTNSLHSVTYEPDPDGVARRVSLLFKFDSFYVPSLSSTGFHSLNPIQKIYGDKDEMFVELKDSNKFRVPLESGRMRLYYYSSEVMDSISRISVGRIIDSYNQQRKNPETSYESLPVNPLQFQGKIIILGTSAAATHDDKVTPYGRRPGMLIHAVALSNLLQKDFLDMAPDWVEFILLFIFIPFCTYLIFYSQRSGLKVVIPLAILFGYVFLSLVVFKLNIHMPMAGFLAIYPLTFLGATAYLSFTEGAERRKYSKVLSNMVDPSIVSEALNDLEALKKGGEKEITAFFSDVAGFSTISEQLSSADLASLLNEYLSAMTLILKQNHGTLDKYIGDAVVGIFSAPIHRDEHFIEAANASLEMIEKLAELKKYWKENNLYIKDAQEMDVRIGLNTGLAKVGFMGTEALASYTMMGDTVNLAARLEAAGKDYGVNILISEFTNLKIKEKFFTKKLDAVRVKGKNEPVNIYELISIKGKESESVRRSVELYEEAFELHLQRKFDEAILKFKESIQVRGKKDKSANMLIERCEDYKISPPPENWDGSYTRTHK